MTIIEQIKAEKFKIEQSQKKIVELELQAADLPINYRKALAATGVSDFFIEAKSSNSEVVDNRSVVYNLMVRELGVKKTEAIEYIGLHRTTGNHYIKKHNLLYNSDVKYTELYNNALKNL